MGRREFDLFIHLSFTALRLAHEGDCGTIYRYKKNPCEMTKNPKNCLASERGLHTLLFPGPDLSCFRAQHTIPVMEKASNHYVESLPIVLVRTLDGATNRVMCVWRV